MSFNKEDIKNKDEDNNKDNINKLNELSFFEQEFNQNELYPFEDKSSITEHNKSELSFKEDHHLDNFNFIKAFNKQFYSNFGEHQNTMLRKTEDTSIDPINRKRRREKNKEKEISEKDDNEKEKINTKTKEKINEHTKGRKKKEKEKNYNGEAPHNKCKEDNIIRKIKTFIFQHILKLLNGSLKDKHYKFYRLNKHLNEEIKKDFNEELLERTICDIYKNPYLNLEGKTSYKDKLNSELIDKIYKEKTETETIKFLEKKFKVILNDIREKDLENFLEEIRKKEIKNGNIDVDSYIVKVENVLFRYENWFLVKKSRNVKK